MPSKQNNKKNNAARRQRKVRASRGITGLSKGIVGLGDRFSVVMPYSTYIQLSPAAGSQTAYLFRGNSVYDPDFTGSGGVAGLYPQLSLLYNRYRVLSSKITVDFCNTGTVPARCMLSASNNNTAPSAFYSPFQRHIAMGDCAPGGPISWKHTATAETRAIFGVPKTQVLSEDDFAGIVGGVPNNVWYWQVLVYNPSSAAGSLTVTLRIDYNVVWSMPLTIAP